PHPATPNAMQLFYITHPALHIQYAWVGLIPLLSIIGGIWYMWYKRGRDSWFAKPVLLNAQQTSQTQPPFAHDSIVVEYEPPEDLRPAEVAALLHERATTVDITATIIDLANRGYITIKEIPKQGLLGSKDYLLQRVKQPDNSLLSFESLLMQKLFGQTEV